MKQTNAYQLNLIEANDPFGVAPINENTQALENALLAHSSSATTHSDIRAAISQHIEDQNNPHGITLEQIGAAAEGHSHSASSITSGILAIARGGTGASTAAAACTKLGVHSIATRGAAAIPDSSDLDTYLTPGDYYVASASNAATMINAPTKGSGYKLIVEQGYGGPSHLMQFVITSGPTCYCRNRTGGVWYDWREFLDSTAVETTPASNSGKVITSGGVYAALANKYGTDNMGWVTGSYTGNGVTGAAQNISLGFQPSAVFVTRVSTSINNSEIAFGICIRSGSNQGSLSSATMPTTFALGFLNACCNITEDGFSVLKSNDSYTFSLNENGCTYVYLALR